VLERLPQLGVGVLGELPQPEPAALADAAELVHGENLALVLVQLGGELPALHLEDDAKDLDAPLLAVLDELRVVQEPVEPVPGVDLAPGLFLEVGQGDGASPQSGPDQRRGVVGLQVLDHLEPAGRQARVVAVLPREPGVEVDPPLHASRPFLVPTERRAERRLPRM
jgi:hypothetical protein